MADRRIDRSRKALRAALVELIKEKSYDEIQILEITDRADAAKVTFYRHYRNKDELLLDLIQVGWQQIEPLMQQVKLMPDLTDLNAAPPTLLLFRMIESDRLFYKRLCQTTKLPVIIQELQRIGARQITTDTPVLTPFEANQVMASIIGNALWWLLNDIPYTGEQMARIAHWASMAGVMGLRGEMSQLIMPTPQLREATIQGFRQPSKAGA